MAGQIIKKGARTWLVRIFVGRHPETGKRRYTSKTIRGNKKDAQVYLNAMLRDKDLGTFVEPSSATLNEYLDRWLEDAARVKLRERTCKEYAAVLRRYIRARIGEMKLRDVKALTIQSLYSELAEGGLGAPSVRKLHVVLSSALDQAVRWGMLPFNPAKSVQVPRSNGGPRERQIRVLSPRARCRPRDPARGALLVRAGHRDAPG